jgi:glycosyltransferase involved in cell wall biosynthesis
MRIWMVLTVLAPLGGIEAALVPLAQELKTEGHEVSVYATQPLRRPNQNADRLSAAGIRVITSPAWLHALLQAGINKQARLIEWLCRLALPILAVVALADAWRRHRTFQRALRGAVGKLRGQLGQALDFESWSFIPLGLGLRRAGADVVHVHGWGCGQDPPGAMRWLRRRALAVVYTEHNSPDPALLSPMEAAPMNLGDVLIAVSLAGADGLRVVGRATPPVMVIPYSVTALPAARAEVHDAFTLTCFARLHPQKGQPILLEALAQMLPKAPGVQLLLAGAGPTRPELEEQVARQALEKHVTFLGQISRGELPALLARTDVVVLPSYWEGLPVSLIEALSAGKAIVASRVGGNPELVTDGVNGLLVPPGDAPALAEALLSLASDPERVRRMGLASQERFAAGGFAPATVAAQHLAAYRRAIQAHQPPRTGMAAGQD